MADPSPTDATAELQGSAQAQAMKVWLAEMITTWAVRRALESGYRMAMGQPIPTARDRSVPFRRVLLWTVVSASSVAAANVVADRLVLRPRLPQSSTAA